jgi:hypothetical protein
VQAPHHHCVIYCLLILFSLPRFGMIEKGSWFHFIQVGAQLSTEEISVVYVIPLLIHVVVTEKLRSFFLWNALCQVALFLPVVQVRNSLPPFLKKLMRLSSLYFFFLLTINYSFIFLVVCIKIIVTNYPNHAAAPCFGILKNELC